MTTRRLKIQRVLSILNGSEPKAIAPRFNPDQWNVSIEAKAELAQLYNDRNHEN